MYMLCVYILALIYDERIFLFLDLVGVDMT
jgi:hypothetical protein